ncbi:SpoIID/LytB domain-containing protein [bacterium]|nr:SpoIID/LytB domain-containing protein [bacterium]
MRKIFPLLLFFASFCLPLTVRVEIAKGWSNLSISSDTPFSFINASTGEIINSSLTNLSIAFLRRSVRNYCLKIVCPNEIEASYLTKEAQRLGYEVKRNGREAFIRFATDSARKGFLERVKNYRLDILTFEEDKLEARIEVDSGEGKMVLPATSCLRIVPNSESENSLLKISLGKGGKAKRYRGVLEIRTNKDFLPILINELDLEDYLKGVLPAEIPQDFPAECLKAQAIIARTYAIYSLGRHKAEGFDLCSSRHCQVYLCYEYEKEKLNKAIEDTKGIIITYNGKPALTPFHSSCGGITEDGSVWGIALPYLKSRIDGSSSYDLSNEENLKKFLKAKDFNCQSATNFRWVREYGEDELQKIFSRSLPILLNNPDFKLGKIKDIRVKKRTASGRVNSLIIETEDNEIRLEGESIRWAFGNGQIASEGSLPSLLFYIEKQSIGGKNLFKIIGGGSGHGIGFCQWGGGGLARKGYNYSQIIYFYFPGVNLKKLEGK